MTRYEREHRFPYHLFAAESRTEIDSVNLVVLGMIHVQHVENGWVQIG